MVRCDFRLPIVAAAIGWAAWPVAGSTPSPIAAQPPLEFREQIEADWLRQEQVRPLERAGGRRSQVTREADARGGCDGLKTGAWGFHTECETQPWWQVDLGRRLPLDRVALFNRCDGCAPRNARILVLAVGRRPAPGEQALPAQRHRPSTANAMASRWSCPLARRAGPLRPPATARQELLPSRRGGNLRPGRQGATSPWAGRPRRAAPALVGRRTPRLDRGITATRHRARHRARAAAWPRNLRAAGRRRSTPRLAALAARGRRWPGRLRQADDARRGGSTSTPAGRCGAWPCATRCLDFDSILFVKSARRRCSRTCRTSSTAGGRGPAAACSCSRASRDRCRELRCLTADMPAGSFLRPDLSYDGQKVLFAYCQALPARGRPEGQGQQDRTCPRTPSTTSSR